MRKFFIMNLSMPSASRIVSEVELKHYYETRSTEDYPCFELEEGYENSSRFKLKEQISLGETSEQRNAE